MMEIVVGVESDYQEIVAVWEASVQATHDFLAEEDIQFFKPLILNEYLAAVTLYCAKNEDGTILGFIGVAEHNVEMLFLAPESRGKGIGRVLLQFAINNLGATKVDVNEQNPSAVGFYEHMGFKVVGRSPLDGMGKPFPLLHMEL
tara:strand:+ start:1019 stop:1453 length:435 start_codon:yes stop_codon:yes gene_type:complete